MFQLNDNCVSVTLFSKITNQPINDATVTYNVKELDGAVILSNQNAPYQAGSDGNYIGTIDAAVSLPPQVSIEVFGVSLTAGDYHSVEDVVDVPPRRFNDL